MFVCKCVGFVGNSGETLGGNGAFPWFYNTFACGGSYFQTMEIIPGLNTLCSLPPCVPPWMNLEQGSFLFGSGQSRSLICH